MIDTYISLSLYLLVLICVCWMYRSSMQRLLEVELSEFVENKPKRKTISKSCNNNHKEESEATIRNMFHKILKKSSIAGPSKHKSLPIKTPPSSNPPQSPYAYGTVVTDTNPVFGHRPAEIIRYSPKTPEYTTTTPPKSRMRLGSINNNFMLPSANPQHGGLYNHVPSHSTVVSRKNTDESEDFSISNYRLPGVYGRRITFRHREEEIIEGTAGRRNGRISNY